MRDVWRTYRNKRFVNAVHGRCQICGVLLVPHILAKPDTPPEIIDCGGDCQGCIWEMERDEYEMEAMS